MTTASPLRVTLLRGRSPVNRWEPGRDAVGAHFSVGSDPSMGWHIEGKHVQPFHVEMYFDGQTLWVGDASRRKDVLIDGSVVEQWHPAPTGAVIEFGGAALVVECAPGMTSDQPPPPGLTAQPDSKPPLATGVYGGAAATDPTASGAAADPQPATRIVSVGEASQMPVSNLPRPQIGSPRIQTDGPVPAVSVSETPSQKSGDPSASFAGADSAAAAEAEPRPVSSLFALPPAPPKKKKKKKERTPAARRRRLILITLLILATAGLYLMTEDTAPPAPRRLPRSGPVVPTAEPETEPTLTEVESLEPAFELPTRLPEIQRAPAEDDDAIQESDANGDRGSGPTRQSQAIDALIGGETNVAIERYTGLLADDPENDAYKLILKLLQRGRGSSRCIAGRREDGTLCTEVRQESAMRER